jgi:hypothetical protein
VYSVEWYGPRPGLVIDGMAGAVDVNVTYNGHTDAALLAAVREKPEGNTLGAIPLYDAMTPDERKTVLFETGPRHIAEWPALPKSAAPVVAPVVAPVTAQVPDELWNRLEDVENAVPRIVENSPRVLRAAVRSLLGLN